jgi:anti-sigma factor RsiW
MMNCDDVRDFVDRWEAGEAPSRIPEELADHLASCADCRERFGALLPLLERDCRETAGSPEACSELCDAVMTAREKPEGRLLSFSSSARAPRMRALAAAAAAIFVLGLGAGIYFARLGGDTMTVTFMLQAPHASTVSLAGDFNGWSGEGYQLRRAGRSGAWEIKVPLKRGKAYVYNFVIDGKLWITDPAVPAKIDDGFGGSGSLLRL